MTPYARIVIACFVLLSTQGCANKTYLDGHAYSDKSFTAFYGKSVQITYGIARIHEVNDEGQKLPWNEYLHPKSNPIIDAERTLSLGFDGYINNYRTQKISVFLAYEVRSSNEIVKDEVWLFDTSRPARKFMIKCPVVPGSNVKCFLILRNKKMFDLELPSFNYQVSGESKENINQKQITDIIKEVNNLNK